MSIYAKVEGNIVSNVITCEDSNISLMPGYYIKVTEDTKTPVIDGTYDFINAKFIEPKPYESWILNENFMWESPEGPNPDILTKIWDEENQAWIDRP